MRSHVKFGDDLARECQAEERMENRALEVGAELACVRRGRRPVWPHGGDGERAGWSCGQEAPGASPWGPHRPSQDLALL